MGRISMPQGKGSQLHNRRDYEKIGHEIPDNIDQTKTKDNIVVVDKDIKEAYQEIFGEAVEKYNSKQKRDDRKIADYYEKIEHSKNGEKLFYEDVLQWGKKEDFENHPQLREKAKEALKQYAESFEKRNPNLHVIGAYIHMDEASPHLHIDYVPVAHGYKRGMDTRNSLDKALEEMGIEVKARKKTVKDKETGEEKEVDLKEGRYNNRTMAWKERERAFFGDICRELNLEVEAERRSRGSLSVEEYKEAKEALNAELAPIKEEISKGEQILDEQRREYMSSQDTLDQLEEDISNSEKVIEDRKEEISFLDHKIKKQSEAIQTLSLPFDRIAERVRDNQPPTPKITAEKVIDKKAGLLSAEKAHNEFYLSFPVKSPKEAESLSEEISDLYTKHYTKEGLSAVSKAHKDHAKEEADKMIAEARERINRADSILAQQAQIIAQAHQQAEQIKEKAENEKTSILAQAKQQAQSMIEQAQSTLESLKNKILELTGKRERLQEDADRIIEQAHLEAEQIKEDAYAHLGAKELNEEINTRLGLIPLKEKVDARDRMEALYEKCEPFMDDAEKQAYKDLDTTALYVSWLERTSGKSKSGIGNPVDFSDLWQASKAFAAIKDKQTDYKELIEEIKASVEAPHISHGITH